jgi:hypothetical protein
MRRLTGAVWAQEWCELTWFDLAHSSGVDRTPLMSALRPKADSKPPLRNVRFVPILLQKSVAGFFSQ